MRALPVLVFICSFSIIFFITGNKLNQYGASDPLLTLPTSQALVQTGHSYLTHLSDETITPDGRTLAAVVDNYQATTLNGEIVDVYSPGPALLALPLTALLQRFGYDLNDPATNMGVQNRLAFLTCAIVLLTLYFICRLWLDLSTALVVSHVAFFGSSIFANMGLAYFNLNMSLVFTCIALLLLALLERRELTAASDSPPLLWLSRLPKGAIGIGIGLALFLAFSARPSAAILIVVTFGYLVFLSMIAIMKGVVDFAQKEEWNRPKIKSRKRR